MTDNLTTFERLVRSLQSSERQDLLRKLADTTELRSEEAQSRERPEVISGEGGVIPEERFKEQSFLVRLWFGICSLFSSSTPVQLYSLHLVESLGKKLSRTSGSYIDTRQRMYSSALYQELKRLRTIQSFFSSLLGSYEENKGGFFIILSSLMIKKTAEAIAAAADPFEFPSDSRDQKDVRLTCVRAMDSVMNNIPSEDRARMYQAAQGIEWMRKFCAVPLDRILLRFDIMSGIAQGCPIDSVTEEMKSLVNILSSGRKIPVLMLEALFLFSEQEHVRDSGFDLERECSQFLTAAAGHLVAISEFRSTIPLADFVRFSIHVVRWRPLVSESGEVWFMLFRNAWKKRFEQRWSAWSRAHRRAVLGPHARFSRHGRSPQLTYHPWRECGSGFRCAGNCRCSFSKDFYPHVSLPDHEAAQGHPDRGDFYKRENLMEYTDAFSALEHEQSIIENFEERLSPKGDLGEGFEIVQREKMATVKGKARLENMMLTTDSETETIIGKAVTAFTSMDLILGGILDVVRGGPYETLVNLASIQGKQNERFRKELTMVRQLIREAFMILGEAEKIEKDSI